MFRACVQLSLNQAVRRLTTLRPYQQKCVDAVLESLKRKARPAVSLPTGSGKTRIFSYLIQHVKPMYAEDVDRKKVLVVVNRTELVDQSIASIRAINPGLLVDSLTSKTLYRPEVDVFVATYQALSSGATLNSLDTSKFKLIIIDEAHHAVSGSYVKVLTQFGAIGELKESKKTSQSNQFKETSEETSEHKQNDEAKHNDAAKEDSAPSQSKQSKQTKQNNGGKQTNGADQVNDLCMEDEPQKAEEIVRRKVPSDRRVHVMGFSATFWRNDRAFLSDVFDEVAFHENVESMITEKFLCPAKITDIEIPRESLIVESEGESTTLSINDFFNSPKGIELVYNVWRSKPYKSTVIFGCNVEHIEEMGQFFRNKGVDARVLLSKMHRVDRAAILSDFRNGKFPVIMNCQIMTEGTDVPRIDQVILARGLRTTGLVMQMIGRGLRLHPEKEHCNIVMFSNFRRFDKHLHFMPELDNDTLIVRRDGELEFKKEPKRPVEFLNYREIVTKDKDFSLSGITKDEYTPDMPGHSVFRWVERGNKFYLFLFESQFSYFSIAKIPGTSTFEVAYTKRRSHNYLHKRVLLETDKLGEATKFADSNIVKRFPRMSRLYFVTAHWAFLEPTEKQLKQLARKTGNADLSQLTRGAACTLINLSFLRFKLSRELVADIVSSEPKTSLEHEPHHPTQNVWMC